METENRMQRVFSCFAMQISRQGHLTNEKQGTRESGRGSADGSDTGIKEVGGTAPHLA